MGIVTEDYLLLVGGWYHAASLHKQHIILPAYARGPLQQFDMAFTQFLMTAL